jgi:hypothetical protein
MWAWLLGRRDPASVPLVLYSRPGCHLCDEMEEEVRRARVSFPWTLTKVDISRDPALEAQYGQSIPVLWIGGRKAFKGRMSAVEYVRKFERLAQEWQRAKELNQLIEPTRGAAHAGSQSRESGSAAPQGTEP